MYLYINTSSHKKITLALVNKKGQILVLKNIKAIYQQSEKLLASIDKLISSPSASAGRLGERAGVKVSSVKDLKGVIVVIGPGGFTSLRIGVATANALAWACQIPIIGVRCNNQVDKELIQQGYKKIIKIKRFNQVLPEYGKEPNITKSKK